jgi:hypothetical protein
MLASLLVLGCGRPSEQDSVPVPVGARSIQPLEEVRAEVDRAIGEARASTLAQCALIGVGERPCGGPRSYRAYSSAETDSADLAALVAAYNRLEHERNVEMGLVSTCEVLPRPSVELAGGRCVTQSTY